MTAGRAVRRLLVVVLVAAFVVVCLRLGWWQWQRFGLTGSAQNLGYTLQWPVFALFAIFMWWRFSRLEARRREENRRGEGAAENAEADAPAGEVAPNEAAPNEPARPVGTSGQPEEPDDELAAYNRYLAQLHAKESDRAR
jgi:DNA-binding transcriptional regulator of glucitol operon